MIHLALCLVLHANVVSDIDQQDTTKVSGKLLESQKPATEIVVSGTRTPVERAKLGRSVDVITAKEISVLPARTVVDALQYIPGVDLRQRGPVGVQSDISIRGGSYEQTGVLIDGVRMNDVQTGHHSLNVPVNLHDVERIEIVKGGASRLFGSGAMDGAVNIITKRVEGTSVSGSLVGGDFGYKAANVSASAAMGLVSHQLSIGKHHSDGYRQSTDFDMDMVNYNATYRSEQTSMRLYGGVVNKAFGANGFYPAGFPDQWEHTVTWNVGTSIATPLADNLQLVSNVYYRINADEYLLRRNEPAFYRNTHQTNQLTGMAQVNYTSTLGVTSLAVEAGSDKIVSSNLKDHDRTRGSVAIEQSASIEKFFITGGAAIQGYSDRVPAFTGGVDLSYPISSDVRVFGTVNRSMRIPTYTELYYRSAGSIGDSTLRPETALSYEVGVNAFTSTNTNIRISGYHRNANDLIDFAPVEGSAQLRASNVTAVQISGIELNTTWRFEADNFISSINVGGLAQDVTTSNVRPTFYLSDNLKYQGVVRVVCALPMKSSASVALRAFQRINTSTVKSLLDARVNIPIIDRLNIFVEASNIYSTEYVETGFAIMPPRWFRAGITL